MTFFRQLDASIQQYYQLYQGPIKYIYEVLWEVVPKFEMSDPQMDSKNNARSKLVKISCSYWKFTFLIENDNNNENNNETYCF